MIVIGGGIVVVVVVIVLVAVIVIVMGCHVGLRLPPGDLLCVGGVWG